MDRSKTQQQVEGRRVRRLRKKLGFTLDYVAQSAQISTSLLEKIEAGQRALSPPVASALATVLGTTGAELLAPASPEEVSVSDTLTSTPAGELEDDVRRRPFLGLAAAVLAPAALQQDAHAAEPLSRLEDLLLYGTGRLPAPRQEPTAQSVAAALTASRQEFRDARYDRLAAALPARIAAAQMAGTPEQQAVSTAALYNVAVRLCIKIGDNNLVAVTADRALTAARAGGDPLVLAEAQRMVSSSWRRQGSLARATDIVVVAAEELLADTTVPEPERLALRGDLYATAAYTAAKGGDRGYAHALIAEAADSAAAAGRASGLVDGVQGVALHEVSVHYELGDAGRAIEHARTVDPTALPTAERQARFFTDVARAFDQWGKPEQCYRALLAAEQAAPQEVRRGAVRDLAVGLLRHDRRLPGVRDFAARAGVPVAL
ncbi:helix-turn-helix transcriptional regulator [Kitasatospora sp. NPDC002227]|uniref:helix-turn-helix domain-containing protein n=1 Tax=Kitasatospora sp. NPDC002227 TaxID=3154773 RepID=UPI003321541D